MIINAPPSSPDIEKLVLGILVEFPNAYDEESELLSETCFYDDLNKRIFAAIKQMKEVSATINIITLTDFMKKRDSSVSAYEIAQITSGVSYGQKVEIYYLAAELNEKAIRRKFIEVGNFLMKNGYSEEEDIEDIISKSGTMLTDLLIDNVSNIKTMLDGLTEMRRIVIDNSLPNVAKSGLPTGFRYFDKRAGGLQPGDLVIVAAESGMGKTSLVLAIAKSVANAGSAVAIYSLEMTVVQLCARFTSMESGIAAKDIMYAPLTNYNLEQVERTLGKLEDLPVYMDETSVSSLEAIVASIRHVVLKYNVKLVIIDFLQLVTVKGLQANKEQQTAYLARKLKNIAKELKITVIALSQLNREKASFYPTLPRLRDSGQIEEAADIVMFIYRAEVKGKDFPEPFKHKSTKGTALIDIAKGRNIGLFKFLTFFDEPTTCFRDAHINEIPNYYSEQTSPPPKPVVTFADEVLPF